MEEKKKPGRPLSVIYADAKQAITRQVGNTMAAYGLPIFMAEGILSGVLAEIRSNAAIYAALVCKKRLALPVAVIFPHLPETSLTQLRNISSKNSGLIILKKRLKVS